MAGLPRGWKWDQCLAANIFTWVRELQWALGDVTFAELVLDFEPMVHTRQSRACSALGGAATTREGRRSWIAGRTC